MWLSAELGWAEGEEWLRPEDGTGILEGTPGAYGRNRIRIRKEYNWERKEMLRWIERSVSCLRG